MVADVPYHQIEVGDKGELTKTITESDVSRFAELSMDYNPVHLEEEFARKTRFKGRIVHGMLTASLVSAVIGTVLPGKNTIYLGQNLKFTAPVYPGDTVTARVEVTEKKEKNLLKLYTTATRQDGTTVLEGEAKVKKDG